MRREYKRNCVSGDRRRKIEKNRICALNFTETTTITTTTWLKLDRLVPSLIITDLIVTLNVIGVEHMRAHAQNNRFGVFENEKGFSFYFFLFC